MSIVRLGDVCQFINGGAWTQSEFSDSGYPVLKVSNCKPSGFAIDDVSFIPLDIAEKSEINKLHIHDVIIATVGSHPNLVDSAAGRSCVVTNEVDGYYLNQNAVCLRTRDKNVLNQRYLGFLTQYFPFQHYIQNRGKGAANQMRIAISAIKEYTFDLPSIEIQDKIANVLSAYDDLIENNQKQIKLLEEAAQRLYKEWFIDLRFPGHETTPIVDGVPQGWNRKKVVDCLSFHGNGGWGKENPVGKNEHPGKVIRGTDIEDVKSGRFTEVPLRYHTDNDIAKRTLKSYDLVFELSNGNIDNIGRCLLIDELILKNCGENTICASFCKLLRSIDSLHSIMLYLEIQDMQTSGRMLPLKKQGANGINNFDFDGFLNHELLITNNAELIKPIREIMKEISIIQGKIILLTEARDRLLPKLMSEEIEV